MDLSSDVSQKSVYNDALDRDGAPRVIDVSDDSQMTDQDGNSESVNMISHESRV